MLNRAYRLPLIEKVELQLKNRESANEIDETRDERKPHFLCKHIPFKLFISVSSIT